MLENEKQTKLLNGWKGVESKMIEILNLLDIKSFRKTTKNLVPVIAPITFIYLYLINQFSLFLVLAIISLGITAFHFNLWDRLVQVIQMKYDKEIKNKKTNKIKLSNKLGTFLINDKLMRISLILCIIISILAFIFILINLNNSITWILFFLCVFSLFEYFSSFLTILYVMFQYKWITINKGQVKLR